MGSLPRHIAIIMDGNGRWAEKQNLPRVSGHKAGAKSVQQVINGCVKNGVQALTLFAFGCDNWRRPKDEVDSLMSLFLSALQDESEDLQKYKIRLRIIGDRSQLNPNLQEQIQLVEQITANNQGLQLAVAVNYSGKWDIVQAAKAVTARALDKAISIEDINESLFSSHLSLADLPEPDLFIRTSGEQRISNFLLWQLAYTEFYFTDVLWPDFGREHLEQALISFSKRQRRYGYTSEQIEGATSA